MIHLSRALTAAAFLALAASASAQTPAQTPAADTPVIAYHGAILIDGTGAAPHSGTTILVQGERILAIQPDAAAAPQGAERVDVSGLHVLPGLIDSHVHIATPPNADRAHVHMRRWLYSGVTAVRGMADDLRSVGELARQARVGEVPSPDIYYAALMAGEGFFDDPRTRAVTAGEIPGRTPWMQAITPETDLPLAVAMARGTSASGIKIYADLPAERIAAVTAEAHRQGFPVWTHAMVYPATPQEVIDAGPDVMSHACILAHQAQTPAERPQSYASRTPIDRAPFLNGDNPVVQRLLDQMRDKGIVLDATVWVYADQERAVSDRPGARQPICSGPMVFALTRQAYRTGVAIAAGTDGETPEADPWPALLQEMELLQNAVGMTPGDVIVAATATAARTLNQDADMGTLAPGKLANMIFVAGDPSADVANLRRLVFTVKRGQRFERADFAPAQD
ncbi:amidohydrolase family protein [Brevundimonas naejangsanensis]|uniref:amidohydrolase family protein n=1 Tax=Brevundimonas naejangsanensis TaxID=588932 RepID=UPI0026F351BF|nr:amidohydrolase family protein [Brevundimonas naejangsanensis]